MRSNKISKYKLKLSTIILIALITLQFSVGLQAFAIISREKNSSISNNDLNHPDISWNYFNSNLRPNSDISNNGFDTNPSGGSIYEKIDDSILYPDSGGDSDYIIGNNVGDSCELDMSSISLGKGQFVTSIKIYARGRRAGSPGTLPISFSFSWRIGSGTYSISKSLKYENTNFYWLSTSSWTGLNLTQSDINNLRVRIRIVGTNPVDKELHLSVMYVQLTVMSNEAPTVNLISPNGGETLQNNTLITWSYNDPENQKMRFNLYHNATGTGWTPIVSNLINKTSYLWNLSSFTQRYYNVSIKIEAFDFYNSSDEDISDGTFTILVNHVPSITVTAPNGGEVLENSTIITWSSNDQDGDILNYNISYYIEGSGWFPLVSNLYNVNSYIWNLSSFTERKEKVLIKIIAFDEYNGTSEDVSDDYFTIFVNHAPSITITAPNGGEILENNTLITWTFIDLDNDTLRFNISYYIEGSGWYSLVSNLYNVSSYQWNLSSFTERQEKVLIKIVAFDEYNGTSEDVSDDYFTIFINHPPIINLITPNGE
ncbi:MAG: hypothetical protein ACTSO4_12485, partial [Promethearchaeota archaeon]